MITATLRKSGDDYVVTVPRDEVERQRLTEGQLVELEVRGADACPGLSTELQAMFDEVFPQIEPGLRYLADR